MFLTDQCVDTDNGATDLDGYSCEDYHDFLVDCGRYDDDDFSSLAMCCACKKLALDQGKWNTYTLRLLGLKFIFFQFIIRFIYIKIRIASLFVDHW